MSDSNEDNIDLLLEEANLMHFWDLDITRQQESEIMGEDTQVLEVNDFTNNQNMSRFIQDPWQNKKLNCASNLFWNVTSFSAITTKY